MVLGMHRSGTSALTRIFNLLGADLPTNLLPPSETNKTGYWESRDLTTIHDGVLASAGSNWHDWRPFNQEWFSSPLAAQYQQQIVDVLRRDFAKSQLFAIKDPRVCRLWPLWRDVLEEFGAGPLVVMPIRNPLEVAASLKRRNELIPANIYLVWLRHVIDAEFSTRDLPRAVITYDSLLDDWQEAIAAIGSKLKLSWPRRGPLAEIEIENFLSPELKHYTKNSERLAAKADIIDWAKDAYAALTHLAEHPEHPADLKRLDAIRAEFDKASSAFGVAFALGEAELAAEQGAVAALRAELTAAQGTVQDGMQDRERLSAELDILKPALDELLQLKAQSAAVEQSLARAQAEMAAAREDAARQASERDRLAAGLEEQKAAAAQNAEQAAALAQERETLHATVRERDGVATRLDAELKSALNMAAQHKGHADAVGTELASARSVVKDRDGAIVRLMRDLDGARGYLRESQTHVQRLTGELDGARTETKRGETERARLAKIVADGAAELEATHLRIATLQGERDSLQTPASQLPALRAQVEALKLALADARIAADRQDRTIAESTARLEDTSAGKDRLAEELERTKDAARRRERSAADRIAALEASRAAALTESDNRAAARIRALQVQLIDAEAALAKYKNGRRNGAAWARRLSVARRRALRQIVRSGLFDVEWYAREYPDATANGRPPVEHYLDEGYLSGYRPNPLFDTRWYLEHYEDVRRAGVNPLLHYIHNGAREGRDPGPDFHTDFYLVNNPDVHKSGMNPLRHYLHYGRDEGRPATRTGGSH